VYYAYKYRLNPTDAHHERLSWTVDTCRQVYNHFLHRLNQHDETPAMSALRAELPDLKQWWTDLQDVYSRTLQVVVERLYDNLKGLSRLKEDGYRVGSLNWKAPREFRSFTYSQRGFKLDKKSGRTVLHLSKIGDIPINLHREIPDNARLKQVTVKQEPTGNWFATFGVETDPDAPPKPDEPERCVGIDVGILKFTHDTDGHAVGSLDLSAEEERLEHEQRVLSRKEHGSNNYRRQQRKVARRHADIERKRRDFLHKLSAWYAKAYDFVAVENLDAKGLMELPSNSHNRASAAWGTFRRMLEYKCEREGTHFAAVDPKGTTKECSRCGVETSKPLWVREHSCPACGYTADRDANAAENVLQRGFSAIGMGCAESTPSETATAVETDVSPVSASRVIEQGSPTLKRSPLCVGER
jgi:putative transposase